MELFDTLRPMLGNRPRLLYINSIVPQLTIVPRIDGTVAVQCMLPSAYDVSGYVWHTHVTEISGLPKLLHQWYADPELALDVYFNWQAPIRAQSLPPAKAKPNAPPTAPNFNYSDLL